MNTDEKNTEDQLSGGGTSLQEASEEGEIIELVDEVEDEPESEDQETIELTDVVEEQVSEAEGEELPEFSVADHGTEESVEDILLEDLGIEVPEKDFDTGVDQKAGPDEGPPSERPAQPTDEALESTVLENLSEERIEAIIRRVVTEIIEKKADRILLDVAEAAIAKEIERLKQAL